VLYVLTNDLLSFQKRTGNRHEYVILSELLRISISFMKSFRMKGSKVLYIEGVTMMDVNRSGTQGSIDG
jgi:hypothetical protein